MHFNLVVQHAVPGNWDVIDAYAGSRGIHLIRVGDANLAPSTVVDGQKVYAPQLGRRNPHFASIWERMSDAQSYYNALQLSANKHFSRGLRAQVSYTFSRTEDDAAGTYTQD